MRVVDAVLEVLRDEGVDRVFGNPGTTELPFVAGLGELPYVLAPHEGAVVAVADGYARATRRTAFVSLHVAAGTANGLIGMLNALRSRVALVVTAGQQDSRHLVQDPMLSGDLVGLARSAAKSVTEVHRAADVPLVLRRAFRAAATPPEGPVFVSIPMDLFEDGYLLPVPARARVTAGPGPAPVDAAVPLLTGARAPAIVAGDGVGRSGAVGAFVPHHYTPDAAVGPGTRLVQLDDDPSQVGRTYPVDVGLVGEVGLTLAALAEALPSPDRAARERAAQLARDTAARDERRAATTRGVPRDVPLDPALGAAVVADALPAGAVLVAEAITVGLLLRERLGLSEPDSFQHTVGGGLGWGIGAAVGVSLGRPDRPVVAALGDGSALFGVHGLWTAASQRTPVTLLVFANGEYRTLKQTLTRMRDGAPGPYPGMDLAAPTISWPELGMGICTGTRCRKVSAGWWPRPGTARALRYGRPARAASGRPARCGR